MDLVAEDRRARRGSSVLGWREVPVDLAAAARGAASGRAEVLPGLPRRPAALDGAGSPATPSSGAASSCASGSSTRTPDVYFPSLSTRTFVYKGMLAPHQLRGFFPDLTDERLESRIALVHSRFSTNTFPSWPLAHPYRLRRAQRRDQHPRRQPELDARPRGAPRERPSSRATSARIFPIVTPGGSDSATFDEVLELLHLAGRPLRPRRAR